MTQILIRGDGTPPTERELAPGTVTIGRKSDNDLCLEDATVSGRHAKIVTYFQSSHIEDLGSTNGTFVNGRRVRMHTLHPGDVIQVGKYELQFGAVREATAPVPRPVPDATVVMVRPTLPAAAPATTPPGPQVADKGQSAAVPAKTAPVQQAPEMALSAAAAAEVPEFPPPPPASAPAASTPSGEPSAAGGGRVAYLKVMVGERAGQRLALVEEGVDLVPGVRVQRQGDAFVVRRLSSAPQQVVRLNSKELSADSAALKDMDMLQVGSTWMAFFSS